MKRIALVITFILLIPWLGVGSLAKEVPPRVVDASTMVTSFATEDEKSAAEYTILYEMDFEYETLSESGWTSVDLTQPSGSWQKSEFNAANLDPTVVPVNHAWWCGEMFDPCPDTVDDLPGGYGPHYNTALEWAHPVDDTDVASVVFITAVMNVDTELNYDFVLLEYWGAVGWQELIEVSGVHTGLAVNQTFNVQPNDYRDGEIVIRWRVTSDTSWDALDCLDPNDGAAQIDNIGVSVDGIEVSFDDGEPGTDVGWQPRVIPGVGDFANVRVNTSTMGLCPENINTTSQLMFVNDGQYEPDVPARLVTYSGYTYPIPTHAVEWDGGLAGEGHRISNIAHSPTIDLDPATQNGVFIDLDWYLHTPSSFFNIYAVVMVRSRATTGGGVWSEWSRHHNGVFGDEQQVHMRLNMSPHLVPDCEEFQIALGVEQLFGFPLNGDRATPVVYFDNVVVSATADKFNLSARSYNLAQDGFPVTGFLDPISLHSNSVRFDAGHNVAVPGAGIDLGDSVVVSVRPNTVAEPTPASVELHYSLEPNALYDSYRPIGFDLTGTETMVFVAANLNRWAGDLQDDGAFFPGDVLHYYFAATDADDNVVTLPAELTGFDNFDDNTPWPEQYTFRALPSHISESQPAPTVLFWNDSGRLNEYTNWPEALREAGLQPGVDFDMFTTMPWAGGSSHRTGVGTCATLPLLNLYDIVVYTSGIVTYAILEEYDIELLDAWLASGNKKFVASGNHLVSALEGGGAASAAFLANWLCVGTGWIALDVPEVMTVIRTPEGEGVFQDTTTWTVAGCPAQQTYESMLGYGGADDTTLARYDDGSFAGSSAAHEHYDAEYMSTCITLPYDLDLVTDTGKDLGMLTNLLEDLLAYFGLGPVTAYLQTCDLSLDGGAVEVNWRINGAATSSEFRLDAVSSDATWTVPHTLGNDGTFSARDDSPNLVDGQTVTYSLKHETDPGRWTEFYNETITYKAVPWVTQLTGAHPNPFNPSTKILFSVRRAQEVEIAIYDLSGRLVNWLAQETFITGDHELTWDGRDAAGARVPSGTYFLRMTCEDLVTSQKVMMIK